MPAREPTRGAWRRAAAALLRQLAPAAGAPARLRLAARELCGRPYLAGSLIGGPALPERLVVRLDAFDCVTFVEACLALARSADGDGFLAELVATRYRHGRVSWPDRLHYFSDWLRWNRRRGALRLLSAGPGSRELTPRLAVLEGLPARTARFHVVPRRALARARARLPESALVAFASLRAGLDFFHTGLLFGDAPGQALEARVLIHASRSRGGVTAEPLGAFLRRNRTRGLALAGPLPGGEHR
ncbi:MAG TPA: DUF1460 domain-containing protein [Myxococcota bacterium]|nr:DUF1460 domain-containing protein [Myxococcota bacterium]HRY94533.1 DUF1460 domain-containing protein [Myxococcota bacterium]HSA20032.1 DUF1460 domain-containing protein [Myxococcota bacterium]